MAPLTKQQETQAALPEKRQKFDEPSVASVLGKRPEPLTAPSGEDLLASIVKEKEAVTEDDPYAGQPVRGHPATGAQAVERTALVRDDATPRKTAEDLMVEIVLKKAAVVKEDPYADQLVQGNPMTGEKAVEKTHDIPLVKDKTATQKSAEDILVETVLERAGVIKGDPYAGQLVRGNPITGAKVGGEDDKLTSEWDASKTAPSKFQQRRGSIFATPNTRDGHIDKNTDRDAKYHTTLVEKGWAKITSSRKGSKDDGENKE
ncbi:c6 zinc finger domain containing protein [Diplocarpon rosae]|nr:c6 zinc finger domain containing protein [Diplocarpon rosae]